jgi:hypothetical protein
MIGHRLCDSFRPKRKRADSFAVVVSLPPRLSLLRMALWAKLPEICINHQTSNMKTAALIFIVPLSIAVSAQAQKPTTGYAPDYKSAAMPVELSRLGGSLQTLRILDVEVVRSSYVDTFSVAAS